MGVELGAMRRVSTALAGIAVVLIGCGQPAQISVPTSGPSAAAVTQSATVAPTGSPTAPSVAPDFTAVPTTLAAPSDAGFPRLTCGARTFPVSALDAPTGAESAAGPPYDALRATLAVFGTEMQSLGLDRLTWRLVGQDAQGAQFLARAITAGPEEPAWVEAEIGFEGDQWVPSGVGQCRLRTVLSAVSGPASWTLDPSFPAPAADATTLHLLVTELACSSGRPPTGRISEPLIATTATTVTITIGVRPLGGDQNCPGLMGTPIAVTLPGPLGNRTLLDGGTFPAQPPSAP